VKLAFLILLLLDARPAHHAGADAARLAFPHVLETDAAACVFYFIHFAHGQIPFFLVKLCGAERLGQWGLGIGGAVVYVLMVGSLIG
jgi:hypothetical protein